jgi:NAD(P)-dependent dehydrogenase (short-subunit alcohol dehydrogenase family)
MTDEFAGLVVVVTGAAQGIGRVIAEQFHSMGARLLLLDCNEAEVSSVAESLRKAGDPAASFLVVDLADPLAIKALAAQASALLERVDVLINNAGIELDLPLDKISAEAFDRVIAVNLRAPLLLSQALVPLFPRTGGAIVNISSIHADHAFPNAIPYACSKAGLMALTRNLALELAPRHIRVNAICPGYIDTPMWDEWLRSTSNAEAAASETEALHPLGRRGLPCDVASAVLYLASSQTTWITGTSLVVDGGLTVRAHP